MYRQKFLVWGLIILLVPSLACGLLEFGAEEADESSGAVQVDLGAEEAVADDTPVEEAAAVAVEEATENQSTGDSVAEQAAVEASEEVVAPEAEGEVETTGPAEFTGVVGPEELNAYRAIFSMEFDGTSGGQPTTGRVDMDLEATKVPNASHLIIKMEGSTVEQMGGANEMEVYIIEDTLYMNNSAMGGWTSFSGAEAEAFKTGLFWPDRALVLPKRAKYNGTETINGILAHHYTFTQADVESDEATYDQLVGEVWVAEDNHIVKYTLSAEGFRAVNEGTGLFDFGSVQFIYELLDINGNFSITLPKEAEDDRVDLGGSNEATDALPILTDAENVNNLAGATTYSSGTDFNAAVDFYRQELGAAGWQENEGGSLIIEEVSASLIFTKGDQTLSVTIARDGERINVIVLPQ